MAWGNRPRDNNGSAYLAEAILKKALYMAERELKRASPIPLSPSTSIAYTIGAIQLVCEKFGGTTKWMRNYVVSNTPKLENSLYYGTLPNPTAAKRAFRRFAKLIAKEN